MTTKIYDLSGMDSNAKGQMLIGIALHETNWGQVGNLLREQLAALQKVDCPEGRKIFERVDIERNFTGSPVGAVRRNTSHFEEHQKALVGMCEAIMKYVAMSEKMMADELRARA